MNLLTPIKQSADKLLKNIDVRNFIDGIGDISTEYSKLKETPQKAHFLEERFGALWIDIFEKRERALEERTRKVFE